LTARLYGEFESFFPDNAVEYNEADHVTVHVGLADSRRSARTSEMTIADLEKRMGA
jgi:hypothetical protein